ncbi:MAG: hypothetical protein LBL51_05155 [Synergistaceae bacterium]|jgi:V/A-type H+-transporting ATPase subunit B|nr:hypothetical protein [Synergistaceae bacterium]
MSALYREGSREISGLSGSLLYVSNMRGVGFGELVSVEPEAGEPLAGRVVYLCDEFCAVQVFEETTRLETARTAVRMERDVLRVGVGEGLRGRVLNGRGTPIDGGGSGDAEEHPPVDGCPINPMRRAVPSSAIETGLSALDITNPLLLGQSVSLSAEPGLPVLEVAAEIVRSLARTPARGLEPGRNAPFLVVFAAVGLADGEAGLFAGAFGRENGAAKEIVLLNRVGDPVAERLLAPHAALTIAEHFAFVKGEDVLVVVADMFRCGEAFGELGLWGGEPLEEFALKSQIAGLCGRGGCLADRPGSVTRLFVSGESGAHPFVRSIESSVEARIVLSRRLHRQGIFPPIDPLESCPRLTGRAKGGQSGFRAALAAGLRSAYAESRRPARAGGAEGEAWRRFAENFERRFLAQSGRRTLAQSEALARELLTLLPPGAGS